LASVQQEHDASKHQDGGNRMSRSGVAELAAAERALANFTQQAQFHEPAADSERVAQ